MKQDSSHPAAPTADAEHRRLRIACVITDLDVGGAERALVELATRLDRNSFEVRVWSLQPERLEATRSLVPVLRAAGVPVEMLNARGMADTLRVTRQLAAAWRAWQPDVVQTFLFHANILGRLAAWRAGVRHVVSGIRVAERRSRWQLRLDRWTEGLVERHVCVSQAVADFSRTTGGLAAEKLVVIPNGIDASRFDNVQAIAASTLGLPAGRRWITFVGRLDPQKSLDWLLETAPEWLLPLAGHDLVIVGDGPLTEQLTEQARRLGLSERVHFTGWRADVPTILAASELLVLPSRWEGMPNVVLEAMAARRPVVAADVEGVRELLGDNAGPQIATPGDLRQWSERVRTIVEDPQLAAQLGERNRQRVEEQFTLPATTRKYEQLYRSLVLGPDAVGR